MTRLIDADALFNDLNSKLPDRFDAYINKVIMSQPTVDAVPVVRCEHCAHKKNCQWYYYSGDDYGFCNWAVREDHGQN